MPLLLQAVPVLFILLAGLTLGSFFNVLILRLPGGELLKTARSVCPRCGRPIRALDNIPILSFLLLRGRCRDCHGPISWQYPLVEAATALLAATLFLAQEWPPDLPWQVFWQAGATFILLFLIPASLIDMTHRILPDSITLGGLGLALALAFLPGGRSPLEALLGAFCGGGALFIVGLAGAKIWKRQAMGGGDIKLMTMAGALLGPQPVLLALFLGSFIGATAGLLHKFRTGQSDFAFGPALSAGIILAYGWGDRILGWYWGLYFR